MEQMTQAQWDAIPACNKDVWTTERTDWKNWDEVRDQYMGKRTLMRGGCLEVEGISFSILPELKLFMVTLDWNPRNSEEGDYQVKTWATDEDAAIRNVAEEMAEHPDSGLADDDEEGRAKFIDTIIAYANSYAAVAVGDSILADIQGLLAGPTEEMTEEAMKDWALIRSILQKYGA